MKKMFAVIAMLVLLAACGGTKKSAPPPVSEYIPEWYSKLPVEDSFIYAANVGQSPQMQAAFKQGEQRCRGDMSVAIKNVTSTRTEDFIDQVSVEDRAAVMGAFNDISVTVSENVLKDVSIVERIPVQIGTYYKGYVLMKTPKGSISKDLLKEITKDEELYARFKNSQVLKKLQDETKDLAGD